MYFYLFKTTQIEYNRIEAKTDLFLDGIGGSGDGSFNENETEVEYNLIGWYSTYFDKKLSLSLDYITDNATSTQSDDIPLESIIVDGGLLNPALTGTQQTLSYNSFSAKQKEKQISAILKYKESIGDHDLLGGLQYRKKILNSLK